MSDRRARGYYCSNYIDDIIPMRAIGVSHTACKDEFRGNLRSHSWSVFSFDIIFPVGRKSRCDRFCEDLGRMVPVKNHGELSRYGGCQFTRDWPNGLLNISHKTFADYFVKICGVVIEKSTPMPVGIKMEACSVRTALLGHDLFVNLLVA